MTIRARTALARRAGYLAAALALLFGLGHLAWAAGIPVLGATRASFDTIGQGGAAHLVTGTAVAVVAGGYRITGLVLQLLAAVGRYSFPVGHEATAPGWWVFW